MSTGSNKFQPNVLVIDDDLPSRTVMRILLQDVMGLDTVMFWEDSHNFLTRLQALSPQPDLILMDVKMSPLTGHEMIAELRTAESTADITVVAVTAAVMEEQVQQLKDEGFDGLISKPIVRHLFPNMVRRIMKGESIWYIS